MAAGCTGGLNFRILSSELSGARICPLQKPCGIKAWTGHGAQKYVSVMVSRRTCRSLKVACSPLSVAQSKQFSAEDDCGNLSALASELIPNGQQVESLLTELCDTTSIAEFKLKLHGFHLYVKRELVEKTESPSPQISASIPVNKLTEAAGLNGSVSTTSLAIYKPASFEGQPVTFLDRAADQGLMIIQSPKVGFFRRSRTIKGKRAPPSCKEKQIVKEGQVLCYIEQLGGEIPVESDVSGEVVRILLEDGDPVGYGDAVLAILPSFPGIKQLQ